MDGEDGLMWHSSSLSVYLLLGELVTAFWSARHKIFGGGQGQYQERLSPESA